MFGLYHPLTVAFEQAPAAGGGANNPDATGGKEGDKPATGGGGQPAPTVKTHEITVDGEKKLLTDEEMRNYAQLGFSSTQRYQEASAKEKNGEKGLRISTLISDLSESPSEEKAKELALHLGIDPSEFLAYIGEDNDPPQKGTADKGGKGRVKVSKEDIAEALGMDPAEVKAVIEHSKTRHIEAAKQELRRISDEAVDKDGVFGKMVIGEKKGDRLSVIKDMVAEDVLRKIQDGVPFGADMIAASVQKTRAYLTKFGIPSKPDIDPVVLGLGPGGGLPAAIQAEEPISRKSAAEDGDESNLVSRYLQKGLKLMRDKQRQ
jgi:hypothetical protein